MVSSPAQMDRRNPALAGMHWLVGAALTVTAAVVATIFAVVFAATVAVAVVIVGGVLSAWAVAFRLRNGPVLQPVRAKSDVIEARKVGHAWVAYGWDQER